MKILAIESSCDETACAVVEDGKTIISEFLATTSDLHQKTGGVVPEIAARSQLEYLIPVLDETLKKASLTPEDIDSIAVTVGPGLIGSLLMGVNFAKTLAWIWNKPLIPVNHLIGHIYGNYLNVSPEDITLPAVCLVVSGGHTDLIKMYDHSKFDYLGGTLDDAAGEAFDKVARVLGLSAYFGGPAISKAASLHTGDSKITFSRPMISTPDFNFSFSGIKTSVINKVNDLKRQGLELPINEISYEFEEAVTDVLVSKTIRACLETSCTTLLVGGGVSANKKLREKLTNACKENNIALFIPSFNLCTDNAVYIASAAFYNNRPLPLTEILANPSLKITDVF